MTDRWIGPEPALPGDAAAVLAPAQVASWRERGFALVDGVLPARLLERAAADALQRFPAPGSEEAARVRDFGSWGRMAFPSESDAANELSLHPRLLAACAQLLDLPVRALRMTQADLWPKYGRPGGAPAGAAAGALDNDDQRIHVDYPNHTLTHPPRWDEPEAVEVLLYLGDVADCGGATAVVPREGRGDPAYPWPIVATPGVGALPWCNDRSSAEAMLAREDPAAARFRAEHLYPRERRVRYDLGSVLFYRHDTWHRGTPLRPGALRLALNATFRRARSEWISTLQPGWAWAMYRPARTMERLIARASVDQRCVLGFPPPGSPYWNADTLAAVAARYGPLGMDMAPYREPS